ncbi:MAG: hypothetical protein ACLTZT_16715 [Butyricimonas faecalis]
MTCHALKRRFNTVILPLPTRSTKKSTSYVAGWRFEVVMDLPAEKPALEEIRRVVTIFRELRQGSNRRW